MTPHATWPAVWYPSGNPESRILGLACSMYGAWPRSPRPDSTFTRSLKSRPRSPNPPEPRHAGLSVTVAHNTSTLPRQRIRRVFLNVLVCGLSMHREYVVRFQEGKGGCASDSDSESQFPEWPAHMPSVSVPRPDDMILHCPTNLRQIPHCLVDLVKS